MKPSWCYWIFALLILFEIIWINAIILFFQSISNTCTSNSKTAANKFSMTCFLQNDHFFVKKKKKEDQKFDKKYTCKWFNINKIWTYRDKHWTKVNYTCTNAI